MLSKHFEDLENFLSLLKHYFDIIGISEHKIIKGSKKSAANLPGYTFCFNETETFHGGTVCFVSNNLIYKLGPDKVTVYCYWIDFSEQKKYYLCYNL